MSGEGLSGFETEGDAVVRFVLAITVAGNHVIGRDDDTPWYLSEDPKQLKWTTTGHSVVMGCKTYKSIARQLGGPPPERHSVVLTIRDLDPPEGAEAVESVESAVVAAEDTADEMGVETVYAIGGAIVYEQFLDRVAGLVLTEPDVVCGGDARFPERDRGKWAEAGRDDRDGFSFVTYECKQPAAADRGTEESDE